MLPEFVRTVCSGAAASIVVWSTLSAAAAAPASVQPTNINVTDDMTHRWGEPELAIDPRNPNHLVYAIVGEGLINSCLAAVVADPTSPCAVVNTAFGPQPSGLMNDLLGFSEVSVFVSFDRGRTWKRSLNVPGQPAPADHGDRDRDREREKDQDNLPRGLPIFPARPGEPGDPLVTVGPDGTFYLGWDAIHFANLPTTIVDAGGIAVSKSTDGGFTWSEPVLTGTTIDRPFFAADSSTGVIYEASSGQVPGPLASGDPTTTAVGPVDRHLVSSTDGIHWTTPQAFGGASPGTFAPYMSAAHGMLATAFRSTDPARCGGVAPVACTIFQTTTDAGVTWSRHVVPASTNYTFSPLVTADPSVAGHFTIALLINSNRQFAVLQTRDSGATWTGPVTVSEDATKTHFHPWIAYSPIGVLGLMWQTSQPGPGPTFPYNVWAAVSRDGGSTFGQPLKVSTADSPAPDARVLANLGDDFSFIALTGEDAFVAWADWRPGERAGFISTIDLRAFKY